MQTGRSRRSYSGVKYPTPMGMLPLTRYTLHIIRPTGVYLENFGLAPLCYASYPEEPGGDMTLLQVGKFLTICLYEVS